MKLQAAAVLVSGVIMATSSSCEKEPPVYDADPVGGKEKCFTIDREPAEGEEGEETALGTFCKEGR